MKTSKTQKLQKLFRPLWDHKRKVVGKGRLLPRGFLPEVRK
jgi:hypothetical protein